MNCSIDGCAKAACNSRGWCWGHYTRWRKHGDPNKGNPTPGFRVQFFNDLLGSSVDHCIFWPYSVNRKGYAISSAAGKTIQVHRRICELVHGRPPTGKHQAAHSCGNGHRGCVNPRHISWKTPEQNASDKLTHGTDSRGEKSPNSKLTLADVIEIKGLRGVVGQRQIAKRFGVSRGAIMAIHLGRNWAWVDGPQAGVEQ